MSCEPGYSYISELSVPVARFNLVLAEARDAEPYEACGLVVGQRSSGVVRVTRTVPCENRVAIENRRARFEISPQRLIEEERALLGTHEEVVGFYHSHPMGRPIPSELDLTFMALWPDKVWLIIGLGTDGSKRAEASAWCFDPEHAKSRVEVPIVQEDREGRAA